MSAITEAAAKERGILFSSEMIRALLVNWKTQTRRIVKRTDSELPLDYHDGMFWFADGDTFEMTCPYGQVGDRLWVREMLQHGARNNPTPRHNHLWRYAADNALVMVPEEKHTEMLVWATHKEGDICVSIHMPRWASRITLEITEVRVERVQEISHRDALAEGVSYDVSKSDGNPCARYRQLWDKINPAADRNWKANPWVWALSLKRVK